MPDHRAVTSAASTFYGASQRKLLFWRLTPMQVITLCFAAVILVGAVLLALPIARPSPWPSTTLHALFTATSATCLVGIQTVSFTSWSGFGQLVILLLVQAGAIGYMSAVVLIARLLGIRLGTARDQTVQETGVIGPRAAWRIIGLVTVYTLAIEAAGALLLALRFWLGYRMPCWDGLAMGLIYSVSGFCNTKLRPLTNEAISQTLQWGPDFGPGPQYGGDLWLLGVIGLLAVLGGLGIGVLRELPRRRRMSLFSRLAVISTLVLIALGAVAFYLFEMRNTLALLPDPWQRGAAAVFMSISARSAGFDPVPIGFLNPPTLLVLGLLALVGGASGGTAGGFKVTTLAVIVLAITALARHRSDIEIFGRRTSGTRVRLALSLVSFYLLFLLLVVLGISFIEFSQAPTPGANRHADFLHTLFTTSSAFSSVGWGSVQGWHPASLALLMVGMFVGRLGTLGMVAFFARASLPQLRRLPEEAVMTG